MTEDRARLLKQVLEQGIGAGIEVKLDKAGLRTGLRAHFSDLGPNSGPICTIRPAGLRRHSVLLKFGDFSAPCIRQIQEADYEQQVTARGLLKQVAKFHDLKINPDQGLGDWMVSGGEFNIEVTVRNVDEHDSDNAVSDTAKTIMVPLMAAMAELIGYDEWNDEAPDIEGEVTEVLIRKRERSRRNRYLCLSIHGNKCAACGFNPLEAYGESGNIIEVHHLEPVSLLEMPRQYDPVSDLVPLCPNCHRLIHARKPVPFSLDELKELLADAHV